MKKALLLFLVFALSIQANAQVKSQCDAALAKVKNYYNLLQIDSITNMMSDKLKSMASADQFKTVYAQLGEFKTFEFTKKQDNFCFYKAVFKNATISAIVAVNEEQKLETLRFLPYQEDTMKHNKSNFVLKTATGNIYGTLTLPESNKKVPVVLFIAGSGPTDRDGNNTIGVYCNAYKMIADSLKDAGIACVRYDKRGVGESAGAMKSEEAMRFDDMVSDAEGFIHLLKEDTRFSKVIVAGHSEGSLVGMIAAEKAKAPAYISISGIARRADKVMEAQINQSSPLLEREAETIFDSLDKGYLVKNIDPDLNYIFHASVQPYLISWLKYEPAQEIKKLKVPMLILQGTTDIQVSIDEANKLKKAAPYASLKLIKGMNHILKEAPADRDQNIATYSEPALPLCPGLMPGIISFIAANTKK